jgi:SAM-dependent methyltransferase
VSGLRARWQQERFAPGWLGLLTNPFYFARRGLRRELIPLLAELKGEVLDVGCGRKPYRSLVDSARYVGVDIDSPATREIGAADIYYDGSTLPFDRASFDAVICSQVLEHIFAPDEFLREIWRVLRPGGQLVLTVPFAWDEHEQPLDFARYSSFGIRSLLERNQFEVIGLRKSVADARALFQLAGAWVFKVCRSKHRSINVLVQLAAIAPLNVVGVIAGKLLPGNSDFYLDNVVTARKRGDA